MNPQEPVKYEQPSAMPVPKVQAAGIAGTVLTIVIALANVFGIVIPPEVSGAALTLVAGLTTIVTFLAAYWKRDAKPPAAVEEIVKEETNYFKG